MKRTLFGMLVIAATAACAETAAEPAATDTQALLATAPQWTPAALVGDLQVDGVTRQRIEAGLAAMHASMLGLHGRIEQGAHLTGSARENFDAELRTELRGLHEQHVALWESLDDEVRTALAAKLHEHMQQEGDGPMTKLHEHLRRMHGAGH